MFFDVFGAITSFLATYYFIRLKSQAWIISLAAIIINGWLYWQKGIYSDMMLELFYFVTTCYGWITWKKPIKNLNKPILTLNTKQWLALIFITGLLFLSIWFILASFTHSNIAILDALTTSLSLTGQWLMCHKIITTWLIWFITDAFYAYLYLKKQIPFHVALMLVYTMMAIYGYFSWRKKLKDNQSNNNLTSIC